MLHVVASCMLVSCFFAGGAAYDGWVYSIFQFQVFHVIVLDVGVLAGARSKVYASMFSAGLTGMAIGPCAAAATFAVTGNAWQIKTLEHVILVRQSYDASCCCLPGK